jgi:hypothetical protein
MWEVAVRRPELTDPGLAQIQPLLSPTGRPGGQWVDHGRVLNGILCRDA